MTLADGADGQAVEAPLHGLAVELAHQPADGPRETQVVGLPGRSPAPAHASGDLQAGDETGDDAREHVGGSAALGLDPDDGELGAVDDLAAHVLGPGATGAGETLPGLGEGALGVVGDLGLGAAEVVDPRRLLLGHAGDQHGDAPRRHQDPGEPRRTRGGAPPRAACGRAPGVPAPSSIWRTTDSQTLYGSSSQPISMRSVLMRPPPPERLRRRRPRARRPRPRGRGRRPCAPGRGRGRCASCDR